MPDRVGADSSLGDPCTDWMKLAHDSTTGQEIVCGANISPATDLSWILAHPMDGRVHVAGTPCPDEPQYVLARSTHDYVIWCVTGEHVYLPGGVTITLPPTPTPIWELYSP